MLGEIMSCCLAGNVFRSVVLWLQRCFDSKGTCKKVNATVDT